MVSWLAKSYDNYIVHKLKLIIQNRSYTTSPEEMELVHQILHSSKEELFILDRSLPISEVTAKLKKIAEDSNHLVYQFDFTSPHLTKDKVNNKAYGKYYQSKSNPKGPTVLILPGWMTYREEKYYTHPLGTLFLRAGINYIFYSMPYHMERRPSGVLSGELAVSGDLHRTIDFFRQAISESRTIIHWLKAEQGIEKVGFLGVSLGGLIGAHLLHIENKLDFGILMVPAIDPANILWQTRIGQFICNDLQRQGFTEERYSKLAAPLNPTNYQPVINPKRILLLEGKYDQCVLNGTIRKFCDSWKGVQRTIYREGHFSILLRKKPIKEMIKFIWN